jgi:membrane protein DedA with SNARE-associated domain
MPGSAFVSSSIPHSRVALHAVLILPLVYMVVAAVMFGEGWTNDIRAMVVSSIISLVLGSITGFFLGTSYGSQQKTAMLADRR